MSSALPPPLNEHQLSTIRAFLRNSFPDSELIDRFDFNTTAQRFTLNPGSATSRTLIVPRETLEDGALASLLTERLVDATERAGAKPVTLTTKGIRY